MLRWYVPSVELKWSVCNPNALLQYDFAFLYISDWILAQTSVGPWIFCCWIKA